MLNPTLVGYKLSTLVHFLQRYRAPRTHKGVSENVYSTLLAASDECTKGFFLSYGIVIGRIVRALGSKFARQEEGYGKV